MWNWTISESTKFISETTQTTSPATHLTWCNGYSLLDCSLSRGKATSIDSSNVELTSWFLWHMPDDALKVWLQRLAGATVIQLGNRMCPRIRPSCSNTEINNPETRDEGREQLQEEWNLMAWWVVPDLNHWCLVSDHHIRYLNWYWSSKIFSSHISKTRSLTIVYVWTKAGWNLMSIEHVTRNKASTYLVESSSQANISIFPFNKILLHKQERNLLLPHCRQFQIQTFPQVGFCWISEVG